MKIIDWLQAHWVFDGDEWFIPLMYDSEHLKYNRNQLCLLEEANYVFYSQDIRLDMNTLEHVHGEKFDEKGNKMELIGERWSMTQAGARWVISQV